MGLCHLCKKMAPFNWCCLSNIDVGLWLLEGIQNFVGKWVPPTQSWRGGGKDRESRPFCLSTLPSSYSVNRHTIT